MGKLTRILTAPLRYYRSCGFGVHSPYAFRFVREVVRCPFPRYGYYAYGEIRRICLEAGVSPSRGYRFYRLLVFANPAAIHFPAGCDDYRSRIASLYRPCNGSGVFRVTQSAESVRQASREAAADGSPCYVLATTLGDETIYEAFLDLWDSLGYGMVFTNGRSALLCAVKGLPRQSYRIWI